MKRLLLALLGLLALAPFARAADETLDFEMLRFRAKQLAAKPYAPRPSTVPQSLRELSYDDYRRITFNPAQTWGRREQLPYQLQFFHPGFVHTRSVQVFELNGRVPSPIRFSRAMFDYHGHEPRGLSDEIGFAGFRVLGSLGIADRPWDEIASFLGASYFRALCAKATYGLSARGLAVDTLEPGGEEFPAFEEFWIERPAANAKQFVIFALLDGPSVAGAYRFTVTPGAETVMQVKAVVFCRSNPKVLGLAPLTSMFWHGENSETNFGDFRPEVHDSDGLMIFTGAGEWLWRPLTNPKVTRSVAFADENVRGFGLLQRDRKFSSYEDLETHYQLRPSAWVEPVGPWGRGAVRLAELASADETNDNIVAFWAPAQLPAPGEPIEFDYKLHWFMDQIHPPAGFAMATRVGNSRTHEPELRRFVVDFDGQYLRQQKADPAIEGVVSVGAGGTLVYSTVQKNDFNGTWRLAFGFKPDGNGRPVELRGFLRKPPHVLTETWSYLWQP